MAPPSEHGTLGGAGPSHASSGSHGQAAGGELKEHGAAAQWQSADHSVVEFQLDDAVHADLLKKVGKGGMVTPHRGVTDCLFLLFFLGALGGLASTVVYAKKNGHLRKIVGLPNSDGLICGFSRTVTSANYLYICQDIDKFNTLRSICLDRCPNPRENPSYTSECHHDYETHELGGTLCLPKRSMQMTLVVRYLKQDAMLRWFMKFAEVRHWPTLLLPVIGSLVIGFLYLLLLQKYALFVLTFGTVTSILVTGGIGVYLVMMSQLGGADRVAATGDSGIDLVLGLALVLQCLVIVWVARRERQSLEIGMSTILAASECIHDMPLLLLEPVWSLACKVGVFFGLAQGFMLLVSTVAVESENYKIRFEFNGFLKVLMALYIFMTLWILQLVRTISQFSIAYATEEWFFSSYDPVWKSKHPALLTPFKGYMVGIIYHLGSLAFGSFTTTVLNVLLPLKLAAEAVSDMAKDTQNPIGRALNTKCKWLVTGFEDLLKYLNRTAYMDVAMTGHGFLNAAKNAKVVLTDNVTMVTAFRGATYLYQLTCLVTVASLGWGTTYLVCILDAEYSNPEQPSYVMDPVFLSCISSILCVVVALPFTQVLDCVADGVLFCIAVERLWHRHKSWAELSEREKLLSGFTCFVRESSLAPPNHSPDILALTRMVARGHPASEL